MKYNIPPTSIVIKNLHTEASSPFSYFVSNRTHAHDANSRVTHFLTKYRLAEVMWGFHGKVSPCNQ